MTTYGPLIDRELTTLPAAEEELSEEDQQLKNELDMIVERLTVRWLVNARTQAGIVANVLMTETGIKQVTLQDSLRNDEDFDKDVYLVDDSCA